MKSILLIIVMVVVMLDSESIACGYDEEKPEQLISCSIC